jgi:hypothetical protein
MKLFINSGVYKRICNDNLKIKHIKSKLKLCLSIPNYVEDNHIHETINFIFEGVSKKHLDGDILFKDICLRKISDDSYIINTSNKTSEKCMYALIRSTTALPDDVFIPSFMKDKVTVIKRIRFIDTEEECVECLSNVYLIKINLNCHESLPVYLTYDNPKFLEEHYVFYKNDLDEGYNVSRKLKTFIYINEYNKDQYISLSELCK